MRCMNSAERSYDFLELNDFLERCECAWHIKKAGTQPEGAIPHRLTHHLAHAFEFVRTRCPIGQTDDSFTDCSLSNEGRYIDGLCGCLQPIQKRLDRRWQAPSETRTAPIRSLHNRGDTLADVVVSCGHLKNGAGRMRVNIDEARRNDEIADIDHARRWLADCGRNASDGVAADSEIGSIPRATSSIHK